MFAPLNLGRIAGIPIRLRPTFLLLLGFVFLTAGGMAGVFMVLVTFASVLVHELGHALVARRLDVRTAGIDLHFLGGMAQMIDPPRSARDEIAIAAAGPAVSLALAGLGFALGGALDWPFAQTFGWINLILGLFNLIPALPMDGGRILRAALSFRHGYVPATRLAIKVSRAFVVVFAVGALALGSLQLLLLAGLLWLMTAAERAAAGLTGYRDDRTVDIIDRRGGPVRVYTVRY